MFRTKRGMILLAALVILGLVMLVLIIQMDFPQATGPFAVGRASRHWVDESRHEVLSDDPQDVRELPLQIWYPAEERTGTRAPYFPNLERVAQAMADSGEVPPIAAFGLRFIRGHEWLDAELSSAEQQYPVVILSPGGATNVEFYAGIAGELASYGYIVVGINHPYDVAAAAQQDGSTAQYITGPLDFEAREAWIGERMAVRVEDVRFVLHGLMSETAAADDLLGGRLDLTNVGVMGHSLGGVAAAMVCRAEPGLRACLNLDGIQRGGPFSTQANPSPPDQPFMMITKEQNIPPATIALFEASPAGSYLVVIKGARHDHFSDGPLLIPARLPFFDPAASILKLNRQYILAFFDQTLKHQPSALLEQPFENDQVSLRVFPSIPSLAQ